MLYFCLKCSYFMWKEAVFLSPFFNTCTYTMQLVAMRLLNFGHNDSLNWRRFLFGTRPIRSVFIFQTGCSSATRSSKIKLTMYQRKTVRSMPAGVQKAKSGGRYMQPRKKMLKSEFYRIVLGQNEPCKFQSHPSAQHWELRRQLVQQAGPTLHLVNQ